MVLPAKSTEGPLTRSDLNLKGCDIIENGSWNLDLLSYLLPSCIRKRISDMHLSLSPSPDLLTWLTSPSSRFTVASCYKILTAPWPPLNDTATECVKLSWLWTIRVPHKIQIFLWLCWHDRLKKNSLLHSRNLLVDPYCNYLIKLRIYPSRSLFLPVCKRILDTSATFQQFHNCGVLNQWLNTNASNNEPSLLIFPGVPSSISHVGIYGKIGTSKLFVMNNQSSPSV